MPDTETLSTDLFVDCLAGRLKGAEVGKLEGLKALPDDVPTGVLVPFAVTVGVILGKFDVDADRVNQPRRCFAAGVTGVVREAVSAKSRSSDPVSINSASRTHFLRLVYLPQPSSLRPSAHLLS